MFANISAIGLSGVSRGAQSLLLLSYVISDVEYSLESFLCFVEYLEG